MEKKDLIEIMGDCEPSGKGLNTINNTIFEGLVILNKYSYSRVIDGAEYKVLYSIRIDEAISNGITKKDLEKLRALNWTTQYETHFVYFLN
jgi:hypothetical protein